MSLHVPFDLPVGEVTRHAKMITLSELLAWHGPHFGLGLWFFGIPVLDRRFDVFWRLGHGLLCLLLDV